MGEAPEGKTDTACRDKHKPDNAKLNNMLGAGLCGGEEGAALYLPSLARENHKA